MGVSDTLWPSSIARAILACLWLAQGSKKSKQQSHSCVPVVCAGFAQGSKKIKTAEPFYDVQGDSMYSIYRLTQLVFSTLLKGIIRKECQSFTNHGHAKTPPTVFNPLSLWLTLPRDMGVSHTLWPPGITRAILACLWLAQGSKKSKQQSHTCVPVVCTGFAQGSKKSKQQSRSMMFRVILCVQFYRLVQLVFQHYLVV